MFLNSKQNYKPGYKVGSGLRLALAISLRLLIEVSQDTTAEDSARYVKCMRLLCDFELLQKQYEQEGGDKMKKMIFYFRNVISTPLYIASNSHWTRPSRWLCLFSFATGISVGKSVVLLQQSRLWEFATVMSVGNLQRFIFVPIITSLYVLF